MQQRKAERFSERCCKSIYVSLIQNFGARISTKIGGWLQNALINADHILSVDRDVTILSNSPIAVDPNFVTPNA